MRSRLLGARVTGVYTGYSQVLWRCSVQNRPTSPIQLLQLFKCQFIKIQNSPPQSLWSHFKCSTAMHGYHIRKSRNRTFQSSQEVLLNCSTLGNYTWKLVPSPIAETSPWLLIAWEQKSKTLTMAENIYITCSQPPGLHLAQSQGTIHTVVYERQSSAQLAQLYSMLLTYLPPQSRS